MLEFCSHDRHSWGSWWRPIALLTSGYTFHSPCRVMCWDSCFVSNWFMKFGGSMKELWRAYSLPNYCNVYPCPWLMKQSTGLIRTCCVFLSSPFKKEGRVRFPIVTRTQHCSHPNTMSVIRRQTRFSPLLWAQEPPPQIIPQRVWFLETLLSILLQTVELISL